MDESLEELRHITSSFDLDSFAVDLDGRHRIDAIFPCLGGQYVDFFSTLITPEESSDFVFRQPTGGSRFDEAFMRSDVAALFEMPLENLLEQELLCFVTLGAADVLEKTVRVASVSDLAVEVELNAIFTANTFKAGPYGVEHLLAVLLDDWQAETD